MTRILFISLGKVAFGEAIIARLFARRLPGESFQCYFVTAQESRVLFDQEPRFPVCYLFEKQRILNEILVDDLIDRHGIDIFVLCDYLTFAYSREDFGLGLEFLKRFKRPILSFDCYEWASTDYTLDFLDNRDKTLALRFTDLDGCLRPCPLNKPQPPANHTVCYDFLGGISEPVRTFETLAEEFGFDASHDTIVSPIAVWERIQAAKSSNTPFVGLVEEQMMAAIQSLDRPMTWVRVGDCDQYRKERHGLVTIVRIPTLLPADFDALIAGADGYLATNVASTSLAKRVLLGRSAILFWNTVHACDDGDLLNAGFPIDERVRRRLRDCMPIRSFAMFPLGWGRFLRSVLTGNPYLHMFEQVEILDSRQMTRAMSSMLENSDATQRAALQSYRSSLERLPTPDECIRHFL